jgi:hypothetical protein
VTLKGKKFSEGHRRKISEAHVRRQLKTFFPIFDYNDRSTWPQLDGAKLSGSRHHSDRNSSSSAMMTLGRNQTSWYADTQAQENVTLTSPTWQKSYRR